jgi:hypothetical protein
VEEVSPFGESLYKVSPMFSVFGGKVVGSHNTPCVDPVYPVVEIEAVIEEWDVKIPKLNLG